MKKNSSNTNSFFLYNNLINFYHEIVNWLEGVCFMKKAVAQRLTSLSVIVHKNIAQKFRPGCPFFIGGRRYECPRSWSYHWDKDFDPPLGVASTTSCGWGRWYQHIEMVTLIPRLPLSAKSCAMLVSKTRQSEFRIAEDTPSWMERGVASQVNRRRCPFNSNLYAKFSACFRVPMSWTMAKNCWCPSNFSCFSRTSMKWWPKQDCIITQSTAPGKLISVARKTISSPCSVVIDLWICMRCDMTCSRLPCHLQLAPGQGQE